jgi:hypothetical protein
MWTEGRGGGREMKEWERRNGVCGGREDRGGREREER